MKNSIALIGFISFLFACNQAPKADTAKAQQEIIQADKDMCTLAANEGFNEALLRYSDPDVVKFTDNEYPIVGKKAYVELVGNDAGTKQISWEPVKAEVAQSGELGYTWGNWKFTKKDTTLYGNYFTLWKKQADGSWKFALDGGCNTPAPHGGK